MTAISLLTATWAHASVTGGDAVGSASAQFRETPDALVLTVPESSSGPGYELRLSRSAFRQETRRDDDVLLASTSDTTGPGAAVQLMVDGVMEHATSIDSWNWDGDELDVTLNTSSPQHTVTYTVAPNADRYQLSLAVSGPGPIGQVGLVYDVASAGHWYGHGEIDPTRDQPWPLEVGSGVRNGGSQEFSPFSLRIVAPFWFTSQSIGLWVDTDHRMEASVNYQQDQLARMFVVDSNTYESTIFVENTPRAVYDDYIGITGKPATSQTTFEQYAEPLWNTWAQFYSTETQETAIGYAQRLANNDLGGHAIQIDGGWETNRGDLTFDPARFPNARQMSDKIHELGFDLGLWVSFFVMEDSPNFLEAEANGYLLADGQSAEQPCIVTWWKGESGIIDLGNPEARSWWAQKLHELMDESRVDGFKFDTATFYDYCSPYPGTEPIDYTTYAAEFAAQFDTQGVGIRIPWGNQRFGQVTRAPDNVTNFAGLQGTINQTMTNSVLGYPFVSTELIGGSLRQPPPAPDVLVRWAQAASLTPLMYASTAPVGTVTNPRTGDSQTYGQVTTDLYRAAIDEHRRLAPYIWDRVQDAIDTGEPIMKPLFFDFPDDAPTYTTDDQWMLGDAIMAAPVVTGEHTRDIYLPAGHWYDVRQKTVLSGSTTLHDYQAPLDTMPVFVRLGVPEQTGQAMRAFGRSKAPGQLGAQS